MQKKAKATITHFPLMVVCLVLLSVVGVYGATSGLVGVTLGVENTAPAVISIDNVEASYDPIESNPTTVTFNFVANDQDGVGNLDDATTEAVINKTGEVTRTDALCSVVGDLNSTSANYTCDVDMLYYDSAGADWLITVKIDDLSAEHSELTTTMTYNELTAMTRDPSSVSFGTTLHVGETDIGATDDPLVLNNTGNADFTNVSINALDLIGVSDGSYAIQTGNFTANEVDSADGDVLINNTYKKVDSASLSHGVTATEDVFFYFEEVPQVFAQSYSTAGLGDWTVLVAKT